MGGRGRCVDCMSCQGGGEMLLVWISGELDGGRWVRGIGLSMLLRLALDDDEMQMRTLRILNDLIVSQVF